MADVPRPPVAPTAVAPSEADPRPTMDVVRSAVENAQALVKAEVDLAKAEVTEIVVARLKAVGSFVVVGVLGLFVLAFLGVTLAKGLEEAFAPWLAWLITTGAFLLIAVMLIFIGMGLLRHPPNALTRTKSSLEETRDWATARLQSDAAAGPDRSGPDE